MRIVCHFCGLLQMGTELRPGERAHCAQCGSTIRHCKPSSIDRTLVLSICGLILFAPANIHSILSFTAVGRWNDNRLLTGFWGLLDDQAHIVAILVVATSILAPLARLLCAVAVLLPIRLGHPRFSIPGLQRIFDGLERWAMLDIYLLAIVVAYMKLSNFGDSSLSKGWYPLLGLVLVSLLVSISYDPEAVSQARAPAGEPSSDHGKHKSLQVPLALLLAAIILFVPSYTMPVLRLVEYGEVHQDTVYGAVLELTSGGQYALGIMMFCASIIIPILKIISMAFLIVSVRLRWTFLKAERLMLYRIVEAAGRWSFIDLFVISILVALAELGVFATAAPGPGLVFFACVVVLTMLAALSFDPKLIWDQTETSTDG